MYSTHPAKSCDGESVQGREIEGNVVELSFAVAYSLKLSSVKTDLYMKNAARSDRYYFIKLNSRPTTVAYPFNRTRTEPNLALWGEA
jgi:hypothetical protein